MKNISRQSGFTMIELSIVLLIFGLLVTFATSMLVLTSSNQQEQRTTDSLDMSQVGMTEFIARFGRYPCPADPTLGPASANFGREVCAAPWGGVVLAADGRDADGVGGNDEVLIGSVPFMTMIDPDGNMATDDGIRNVDLTATHALDGWNNKLGYAVSRKLTSVATYRDEWGAIRVEDENGLPVIEPAGSAHFTVFSYGENGRGAYNQEGGLVEGCPPVFVWTGSPPPPPSTAIRETENCDGDARFLSGLINQSDPSYNDDVLRFQTNVRTQLWGFTGGYFDPTWAGPPADAPIILQAANMNQGRVGVQTNAPQEQLDINGKIRNYTDMKMVKFCDRTGNNCFEPALLGGDKASMNCPAGQVITSIERNRVNCAAPPVSGTPRGQSCPLGQFMTGITSLGAVVCRAF